MSPFGRMKNRRILSEEAKKTNLEIKLFGSPDSRTDLYDSIVEKWSENEEGKFQIVFNPTEGNKSPAVEVSAIAGADARSESEIQERVQSETNKLKPEDWSDIKGSFTYTIPGGVSYKGSEEIEMEESLRRFIRESIQEFSSVEPEMMSSRPGHVFHHNGPEQESNMIRSNLFIMAKKANTLHDEISSGDDLPEWVQEKIAVAGSMIDSVYDYLDYEYHKFNTPEMPPIDDYEVSPLMEKKKNGRVVKGKYHGETYKATSAMAKAIEKGASYEELKKMAKWADNPDAVVNAAIMAVKGKPSRKNEG